MGFNDYLGSSKWTPILAMSPELVIIYLGSSGWTPLIVVISPELAAAEIMGNLVIRYTPIDNLYYTIKGFLFK